VKRENRTKIGPGGDVTKCNIHSGALNFWENWVVLGKNATKPSNAGGKCRKWLGKGEVGKVRITADRFEGIPVERVRDGKCKRPQKPCWKMKRISES